MTKLVVLTSSQQTEALFTTLNSEIDSRLYDHIFSFIYTVKRVLSKKGDRTMAEAATIDHTAVYVEVKPNDANPAVTSQPTGNTQGVTQYDAETAKVIFTQSGPPIVVAQKPDPKDKPKDFVNTSCAVLFLCNFVFGILGWHYGSKSNNAWQVGDIEEAKRQAKKALIFVIIGIVVGLLTYALAFGLYFGVYVPNNR